MCLSLISGCVCILVCVLLSLGESVCVCVSTVCESMCKDDVCASILCDRNLS